MAKTKRNSKLISYAVNMASLSLYKTPLNIFSRNSVAKQLPAIICTNYTYFVEIATNEWLLLFKENSCPDNKI